ncbi:hypothetical protein SLEP1_g37199 [Rubroshorea leprosula]|uniref:Uncharacterized protein n=1 Tax=Rubroshorea leprosula TaxID=152421 RepID=A0AAV5KU07_9ROSI|nr:hypothetical protein SLEP1_g37199 [Rubroshorea leprosula]
MHGFSLTVPLNYAFLTQGFLGLLSSALSSGTFGMTEAVPVSSNILISMGSLINPFSSLLSFGLIEPTLLIRTQVFALIKWEAPQAGWMKFNSNGSSCTNLVIAGAGRIIRDQ